MKPCIALSLFALLFLSGEPLAAQYQPIGLPAFQIGADLSMAKAIIDKGGVYYVGTNSVELLPALTERKFGYARLRLFHTPDGRSANGTVNSLAYTIALAKLIRESGMKLLLDFHYSDTWADPSRQTKPAAWNSISFNSLNDSIYNYTRKTLNAFAENGVYPDMVQTGNEINHGILWPDGSSWNGNRPNYSNFTTLIKSAIRGVRESTGGAALPVMLHSATGGSLTDTRIFMDSLAKYDVRYDAIGLSYYIAWHGVMTQLDNNLAWLDANCSQSVLIAETSYQADGTVPAGSAVSQAQLPFPFTQQGQYDYLRALYAMAMKYPKVKGIYYWGGELIWAGDIGGSWASLFNWDGKARKGLDAFKDLASGTQPTARAELQFAVYTGPGRRIGIRSNQPIPAGTRVTIHDLQGKLVFQDRLEGTGTLIGFEPAVSGIVVVTMLCGGNILHREKLMVN
jgi:arabinogalactan endo-1,4-beta-galactosidase